MNSKLTLLRVLGNAYTSEERCVAAGYDNGDVKLFDLKTMSVRWETNLKNGVRPTQRYIPMLNRVTAVRVLCFDNASASSLGSLLDFMPVFYRFVMSSLTGKIS